MERKNKFIKTWGEPQREIPFSIDVKGGEIETLMRSDDHRGEHEHECFHI